MTMAAVCCRSRADGFGTHRRLQALAVGSRQLAPINLDRQLVECSRESKQRLVVGVIDASEGIGADVEALILRKDHGKGFGHGCGGHNPYISKAVCSV
jgi:hypothetical protein